MENRYLHINSLENSQKPAIGNQNPAIDSKNPAIEDKNPAIGERTAGLKLNIKTKNNIEKLFNKYGALGIFGRSDISEICGISYSAAGDMLSKMKKNGLIENIKGHGKGKYRFV